MPKSESFTIKHAGRVRELRSSCFVFDAFDPTNPPQPAPQGAEFIGLWDTGASQTAITQNVVDALGLQPTGMTRVSTASGTDNVETYLVNLMLPNGVGFVGITVSKCKLHAGIDVLIGMDIIGSGDFAVTNHDNKTVMSYRMPASKCIDFVEEHKRDAHLEAQKALIKHRPQAQKHKSRKKTGKRH